MLRRSARGPRLRLTPARRRQAEQLRAEWLEHATTTAPADRPAAERAIGRLYELGGLAAPQFVWVDSPIGGWLAVWLLAGGRADDGVLQVPFEQVLADPMWDAIGPELRDSVWAALRDGLGDQLSRAGPRRNLLAPTPGVTAGPMALRHLSYRWPLPKEVRAYYGAIETRGARKALAELDDRRTLAAPPARMSDWTAARLTRALPFPGDTWRQVRDAVHEPLRVPMYDRRDIPEHQGLWLPLAQHLLSGYDPVNDMRTGQADAGGICVDLIYRQLGVVRPRPDADRQLDLQATIARASGPWWPFSNVCIVIERPARLRLEPDGGGMVRLHCLDRAALAWRDGFSLYAWHGVRVPERFTTGAATVTDWLEETNTERRRLLAERIGYQRLLEESQAERIATDDFGTLWRIPTPAGEEDLVVVEVLNSTPEPDNSRRRYVLRVPPDQRVPRDAIGWTFGLPPGTYHPTEMT